MNRSRQDDSDTPRSQSLDELDNFWIDLNEAIAMRPVAKSQIYSVKWKLTSKSVARMWGVLDQLERTRRKKKRKDEVAKKSANEL